MDGTETTGESDDRINTEEAISAVCQWYGYSIAELENEFSYEQVAWLYSDALKRENIQTAMMAELNYQALVVALVGVLNKAFGDHGEIPEKLGIMDVLFNIDQPTPKSLRHFKEGAPDVLTLF